MLISPPVVAALQKQVTNDFRPVWGADAELTMVAKTSQPPAGSWWLVILDDSDQAGALGYHDLTSDGLPLGKVFAASDLKANTSWTVTASHFCGAFHCAFSDLPIRVSGI